MPGADHQRVTSRLITLRNGLLWTLCCCSIFSIDYSFGHVIGRNVAEFPVAAENIVREQSKIVTATLLSRNPENIGDRNPGILSDNDAISADATGVTSTIITANDDDLKKTIENSRNGNVKKRSATLEKIMMRFPSFGKDSLPNANSLEFVPKETDCSKGSKTICEKIHTYPNEHVTEILSKMPVAYFWTDLIEKDIQIKSATDVQYKEPTVKEIFTATKKIDVIQYPNSLIKENNIA